VHSRHVVQRHVPCKCIVPRELKDRERILADKSEVIRYRIESSLIERIAPDNSSHGQINALDEAVLL
jgi:hypothetical protein